MKVFRRSVVTVVLPEILVFIRVFWNSRRLGRRRVISLREVGLPSPGLYTACNYCAIYRFRVHLSEMASECDLAWMLNTRPPAVRWN